MAVLLAAAPVQAQLVIHEYTGDSISTGLVVNVNTGSDFREVHVDSLTTETLPEIGKAGVEMIGTGNGVDLILDFDGGDYGTYTYSAPALFLHTHGVDGASAPDSLDTINGDDGGQGGNVTLNVLSGFQSTSNSPAVWGLSEGGNGGQGGDATEDGVAGGNGGMGGAGGNVTVQNSSDIQVLGSAEPIIRPMNHFESSCGILAQSLGGWGGNGGMGGNGAVGGTGGNGGNGGSVLVQNDGRILLDDASVFAPGIRAESLAGTGGNGGVAGTNSIGGMGGQGGDGADVRITNIGMIRTTGIGSSALDALSRGGNGGMGGDIGAVGVAGGQGGQGGQGGTVAVENGPWNSFYEEKLAIPSIFAIPSVPMRGGILTDNVGSYGIYAGSQGGDGGMGGFGAAGGDGGASALAQAANYRNIILTLGDSSAGIYTYSSGGTGGAGGVSGNGGMGGASGDVEADNGREIDRTLEGLTRSSLTNSIILTGGNYSDGLSAFSFGGMGGAGGTNAYLGGNGGQGGAAGMVSIANQELSLIGTRGTNSTGMRALSEGGFGGQGGACGSLYFGTNGMGGAGGNAGRVSAVNDGIIITLGERATGISAQSIGGDGGDAGLHATSDGGTTDPAATAQIGTAVTNFVQVVVNSGLLNVPTITNIIITAYNSWLAGGGLGSGNITAILNSFMTQIDPTVLQEIETVVGAANTLFSTVPDAGANGGNGGDADAVSVLNTRTIVTEGDYAYGIYAVSRGGNGGNALFDGNAVAGNGGNAGEVTVQSDRTIATLGDGSIGILAISEGGNAGANTNYYAGGNGGNAGAVTVGNGAPVDYAIPAGVVVSGPALIETHGEAAMGIEALSAGGSGSQGGATISSASDGGNGGNAGDVEVDNGVNGTIETYGYVGYGIYASSRGGSGGMGGSQGSALTGAGLFNLGSTILSSGAGGAGGNAGNVLINNDGSIITHGDNAYGIWADSIGGNGGDGGISLGTLFGANGGAGGNAGSITINNTGLVETFGNYSYGIAAASQGGIGGLGVTGTMTTGASGVSGAGADVTVNTTGNVITHGTNSIAISVSSTSGDASVPAGNLAVNIGSAPVPGYLVANASSNVVQGGVYGVGVLFHGGVDNTLVNYGTLFTLDGVDGLAVRGDVGNEVVNNYGVLVGSVELGDGVNGFVNNIGALHNAGSTINLGAGNLYNNAGLLSIGGRGRILTTTLTGDFAQTADGGLEIEWGAYGHDQLDVLGSATLDGALSVYQFGGFVPEVGTIIPVVTSTNLSGAFATLNDPYTNHYAIYLQTLYTNNTAEVEVMQGSFAGLFGGTNGPALTHNQKHTAAAMDGASGDPRAEELFDILDTIPQGGLPGAFDLLAPEEFGLLVDAGVGAAGLFDDNLRSRMDQLRHGGVGGLSQNVLLFDANRSFAANVPPASMAATASDASGSKTPVPALAPPQGWGFFVMGNGQVIDIGDELNAPGGDIKTAGITLGADAQVANDLLMGVAFDYINSDVDFDNNGKATIQGGKGSVFATWFDGNCHLDGALGGGINGYDTKRTTIGGEANGSTTGYELNGMLGGGVDEKMGKFTLSPGASLYYTAISIDGLTETGSLAPLKIDTINADSLQSRLGASLAYNTQIGSKLLKPEVGVYWQHEFLDVSHAIDSRLASGAGSPFTVDSASIGRDSMPVTVGLNMQWSPRIGMHLSYEQTLLRQNYREYNVMAGVDVGL